jgi:transcriptional antiterminator RfaH
MDLAGRTGLTRRGMSESELGWVLLYTKPFAESWADINLRRQGFATLLPLVRRRGGFGPLFPRYLFAGYRPGQSCAPLRSTRGVLYLVHCGAHPARVPADVIRDIRSRMDAHGVVAVDPAPRPDPLFAKAERDRIRALEKLARAGFRVVA